MSLPINRATPLPNMTALLELLQKSIMLGLNCHAVGTIQAFDEDTQQATITVNYTKTFTQPDPVTGIYSQVQKNYPILVDCPVIVMQGGDGALTFPIAAGDTCLILFNDRDIDNWLHTGTVGPVNTPRLHSFADAIALIGLRASNNALSSYDTSRVVLKKGSTKLALGSKIELSNTLTSLYNVFTNLNTALSTFGTAIEAASDPVVITAGTALVAAVAAVQTLVGELLE